MEPRPTTTRWRILRLALAVELGLGLLAVGLAWPLGVAVFARLRVDASSTGWGVLATLPLLALLPWLMVSAWSPVRGIRELLSRELMPLFADSRPVDLALISAAAGFGEELLFRGVLQAALEPAAGAWLAVAGASLLFGLAHAVSRAYLVFATVLGAYLGLWFALLGELWPPMLAHALYDWAALSWLMRRARAAA